MRKVLLNTLTGLVATLVFGCGDFSTDDTVVVPTTPPVVVVDEVQQDIDLIVREHNDWQIASGLSPISRGLSCSAVEISSGTRISSSSPSWLGPVISLTGPTYLYVFFDEINQPFSTSGVSNLLPEPLRPVFLSKKYLVRCVGYIVLLESRYYGFSLESSDGSILYIDNSILINNDGNHGMTSLVGARLLRRGIHSFKIEYMQLYTNHGLILTMDGEVVDPRLFYH